MNKSYQKIILGIVIFFSFIGTSGLVYNKLKKRKQVQTAVQTDFSRFDELQEPEQRAVIVSPAQEQHTAKAPEKPVQEQAAAKPLEPPAPSKTIGKSGSVVPEKPPEKIESAKPAQTEKTAPAQIKKSEQVMTEPKQKNVPAKKAPKQKAASELQSEQQHKKPRKPDKTDSTDENKADFVWSVGFLAEANMNVPKSYVFGTGLYTLCILPARGKAGTFSVGIKGLHSSDFKRYRMVDTAFLLRWNFYNPIKRKNAKTTDDAGFFIQAEGGAAFAWNGQNVVTKPFVFGLGQAVLGYRYTIRNFFIEPYIYAGYPVLWGAGLAGGLRIGN